MAEDRRIRNTKKKIRQAMLECLSTEGLDKISVTMLCNVADINRSTFYTYYSDPRELYELLELEVILGLNRFLRKQEFDRQSYKEMLVQLIQFISENGSIVLAMLKSESGQFKDALEKLLGNNRKVWAQKLDERDIVYAEEFYISGIQSIIEKWLSEGKRKTDEEIAEIILRLTYLPEQE